MLLPPLFSLTQATLTATATEQGSTEILSEIGTGTVIGFFVTLLSSFGLLYLRRKHRRDRLRRAIISELGKQELDRIVESIQTDETVDVNTEDSENHPVDPSDLPPADSIPTSIYVGNTGNLGTLPSEELSEVVEYYSTLVTLKSIIRAIRNEESVLLADKKELHEKLPDLESDKEQLIDTLRSNIGIQCRPD